MSIFNLEGKKIVITGASSGIGRQVAIECSKLGAQLLLIGRNEENLIKSKNLLKTTSLHQIIVLDYLDENIDWEKFTAEIKVRFQNVDGIVHCAGITSTLPFNSINQKKIEEVLNVNVTIPLLLTKVLLKKGIVNDFGASVIFISSVMGQVGEVAKTIYSASKGALNSTVKSLSLELARKNIRVNSISPGVVMTPMVKNGVYAQDPQNLERVEKMHPLGLGKTEDIAYGCIYLLSDASRWVTGSNLVIDGGYMAH